MKVYQPPQYPNLKGESTIFLAGSIEMGKAIDWQKKFVEYFIKMSKGHPDEWIIFNPRRDDWDSSWVQSPSNAQFYQQVDWELTFLERAHYRLFYFAKDTMSPVSLLELGKFSESGESFVIIEPEYPRKGNVEIFCHRYQIPIYESIPEVINQILVQ